tara:strand:- start:1400 stop:2770 length:1371 start_codon:yes stop_codon:yes gene_type:complete
MDCVKEYLLQSHREPHCHKCKREWNRDFQYKHLKSSWINKIYRKNRKSILINREKRQIPETIPFVKTLNKINEYKKQIKELKYTHTDISSKKNLVYELKRNINISKRIINSSKIDNNNTLQIHIKPCPREKCNGFINKEYLCILCRIKICDKCLEVIEENNISHNCNEDNIKSANFIKNKTRPCPKCMVPIFKINGCDLMWCVKCYIAFSWNTGKIKNGNIHNPHYHEEMRNNIVNDEIQNTLIQVYKFMTSEEYNYILMVINNLSYMQDIIRKFRIELEKNMDNKYIRADFLQNKINEKQMTLKLVRRYNLSSKLKTIINMIENLIQYINKKLEDLNNSLIEYIDKQNIDLYRDIGGEKLVKDVIYEFIECIRSIQIKFNKEMIDVGNNYKSNVYYLHYNMIINVLCISSKELILLNKIKEVYNDKYIYNLFNHKQKDRKTFNTNLKMALNSIDL